MPHRQPSTVVRSYASRLSRTHPYTLPHLPDRLYGRAARYRNGAPPALSGTGGVPARLEGLDVSWEGRGLEPLKSQRVLTGWCRGRRPCRRARGRRHAVRRDGGEPIATRGSPAASPCPTDRCQSHIGALPLASSVMMSCNPVALLTVLRRCGSAGVNQALGGGRARAIPVRTDPHTGVEPSDGRRCTRLVRVVRISLRKKLNCSSGPRL